MKSFNIFLDEKKKKSKYATGQGTKGDQDIRDRDDEEEATRSKTRPTAEAKVGSVDDIEHTSALYKDQWIDRRIADYDKQHGRGKRAKEMRADAEVDRKRMYAMDPKWKHAKYSTGEVKGKKSIKGNPKEEKNLWDSWRPKLMEEPMVGQVIGVNQTGGTSDWDLNNHNVFNAVNAFVGSIADREYLIPENAVHQLKLFLERVGMTFPDGIQLPEGNGSVAIPLQRYGGTFGKSATTPYDEFDKEPENVGKTLTVTTEKLRNNSWKVYANIA